MQNATISGILEIEKSIKMKEEIYKETIEISSNIIRTLGSSAIANKLDALLANPITESFLSLMIEVEFFLDNTLEEKKKRMFSFGAGDELSIMRCFIVSVKKNWTLKGEPELIINEMPEDVTLKDNPYKNLHVIYRDEITRDRDYDRLLIVLK